MIIKKYIENFTTHVLKYEDLKENQNLYLNKIAQILDIDVNKFKIPANKTNTKLNLKEMYLNYLINIFYFKIFNVIFKRRSIYILNY